MGVISYFTLSAQTKWINPVDGNINVVHGLISQDMPRENPYHRLPANAKDIVRNGVWWWSLSNAGIYLSFYSDSKSIAMRYQLHDKNYSMPHMPSTGVSGIDLYAIDINGKELWCAGNYSFADTVKYNFSPIGYDSRHGYEYRLYLPLYNSVKWLEIGVDEGSSFKLIPSSKEKKIVLYGTSILQGACASRPGMAWGNILGRRLSSEVINLGFSGNGMLEKEMIDILANEDAKAYVIDCMPNVFSLEPNVIIDTLVKAVKRLRDNKPLTPIILSEHSGYPNSVTNPVQKKKYEDSNIATKQAYKILCDSGIKNLHLLSFDEISQPLDATVEGIHPNDYGMYALADAHEKKLREVLKEPKGNIGTQRAVTQRREPDVYEWKERCSAILEECRRKNPDVVVMGNSLIHQWGGVEGFRISRDSESWINSFDTSKTVNMGCGWDKIENVLWRVYNGALDGYNAKRVILMIGTNNIGLDSNEDIAVGIGMLLDIIKQRQPSADITLIGILPRKNQLDKVLAVNPLLAKIAKDKSVKFLELSSMFMKDSKSIDESCFMSDGLHLNQTGYRKLSSALKNSLQTNKIL